jgi:hypothetical protein
MRHVSAVHHLLLWLYTGVVLSVSFLLLFTLL